MSDRLVLEVREDLLHADGTLNLEVYRALCRAFMEKATKQKLDAYAELYVAHVKLKAECDRRLVPVDIPVVEAKEITSLYLDGCAIACEGRHIPNKFGGCVLCGDKIKGFKKD